MGRWEPGLGSPAPQSLVCLQKGLTLNLKSSWLVEPFMANDWETLRKKQRGFRTLGACALAPWAPKSPRSRLRPGPGDALSQPRTPDAGTHLPSENSETSSSVLA